MKVGFVGCGNMAKAMIGGMVNSGLVKCGDIIASGRHMPTLEISKTELGINVTVDNLQVAKVAQVLVLAVKPHFYKSVIEEISPVVSKDTIIVSIAPGQTLDMLAGYFGKDVKIVRTMPNTPALVGAGMTGVCGNSLVLPSELDMVLELLASFGKVEVVEERMMDGVVAVSGSSPAYVYMFIEALADGAVLNGVPRDKAYQFAAQAVFGSAKMVLETGMHPGQLKDNVCSPGGTTIEAVRVLEKTGFRSSVLEAMKACAEKSAGM